MSDFARALIGGLFVGIVAVAVWRMVPDAVGVVTLAVSLAALLRQR